MHTTLTKAPLAENGTGIFKIRKTMSSKNNLKISNTLAQLAVSDSVKVAAYNHLTGHTNALTGNSLVKESSQALKGVMKLVKGDVPSLKEVKRLQRAGHIPPTTESYLGYNKKLIHNDLRGYDARSNLDDIVDVERMTDNIRSSLDYQVRDRLRELSVPPVATERQKLISELSARLRGTAPTVDSQGRLINTSEIDALKELQRKYLNIYGI